MKWTGPFQEYVSAGSVIAKAMSGTPSYTSDQMYPEPSTEKTAVGMIPFFASDGIA